jgi:NitT/TauT family transport system substrate-binding protein
MRRIPSLASLILVVAVGPVLACSPAPATPGAAPTVVPRATAAVVADQPPPLNGPATVKMGLVGGTSDAGIYVAIEQGYFQQEGLQVEVELVPNTANMMGALGAGQLDGLGPPIAASLFNAAAREVPMRIVADKGSTPGPEWDFVALMVRKELIDSGRVRDYADLRGLTAVVAGEAAAPEIELAKALEKGGLTLADVNLTVLSFPDMISAFANQAIDAGIVIEPFVSRIEAQGTAVRWRGNSAIYGNQQVAVVVFGPGLIQERPEVARHWMLAYLRGLRDYNDAFGPKQQGRDAVIRALTQHTVVKDPRDYDLMRPAGLDPDGRLALESVQADLAFYEWSGAVREHMDVSRLIDTSFQEFALRQLGPYQR